MGVRVGREEMVEIRAWIAGGAVDVAKALDDCGG